MSKRIYWQSGQNIDEVTLSENDGITYINNFNTVNNIQKYYYGIGSINIREVNMINGIVSLESCSVTFLNGNTIKNVNNVNEFRFNKVFQGQIIPIFLKYSSIESGKYIKDEIIIDTQGDILLGKIENQNGMFQLTLDGCFLDLQYHKRFINFISQVISELSKIYQYYQNDLINIESNEYFVKLSQIQSLKATLNILNAIKDNVHHPFDAYMLLCPYMFKYIPYDHSNNIRCITSIIIDILQSYRILEESNVIEMDNEYYYLNIGNSETIKLIINPRNETTISWIENAYMCSKALMKTLEKERHKGLSRDINRYGQYLLVTIHSEDEYVDASGIICIKRDPSVSILNLKVLSS